MVNQNKSINSKMEEHAMVLRTLILIILAALSVSTVFAANANNKIINSFIVCNAYWDIYGDDKVENKDNRLDKNRMGKMAVFLNRLEIEANQIKSIQVRGPNNYSFEINTNTEYDRKELNGYAPFRPVLYYQGFDTNGPIVNGEYTVTVNLQNGKSEQRSKTLNDSGKLLKQYKQLEHKFVPQGVVTLSEKTLRKLDFKWNILSNDAYYSFWLAKDKSGGNFIRDAIFHKNIFYKSGIKDSGLNEDHITAYATLKRDEPYIWFVEILDSNRLEEVNEVIIQPFQRVVIKEVTN